MNSVFIDTNIFFVVEPSASLRNLKLEVISQVERLLRESLNCSEITLQLFGSHLTELDFTSSDVDAVVLGISIFLWTSNKLNQY